MSPQITIRRPADVEVVEQFQGRPHRRGVRIVGVVDDRRAADLDDFAAHRHGLVVGQRRGDFLQVKAQHAAHGHGSQGGVDMMTAPDRNRKPHRARAPPQATSWNCKRPCRHSTFTALRSHCGPVPIHVIGAAQRDDKARSHESSTSTACPLAGNAASNSAFASATPWRLPKPPRWASPICVITPTFGRTTRPAGRSRRRGCAQFQHGIVVLRFDRQHAQGHAPLIIVVSRACGTLQAALQHGMDHLPRRGLAHAAGHSNHDAGEAPPLPPRPLLQRELRVVDVQDPALVGDRFQGRNDGALRRGEWPHGRSRPRRSSVPRAPRRRRSTDLAAVGHDPTQRSTRGILEPCVEAGSGRQSFVQGRTGFPSCPVPVVLSSWCLVLSSKY